MTTFTIAPVGDAYAVFGDGRMIVSGRSKEAAEAMVANMNRFEREAAQKKALAEAAPDMYQSLRWADAILASMEAHVPQAALKSYYVGMANIAAAIAKAEGSK